ncbi:sulfate adenylyltransferase subunit CysN [Salinivirga cyanobacteriivorans]|uniref:sulfate adenylyltransferase n=1 Tax=Salinivirga cyanobacteriivorans TaxID=1307839 RepID=A0A0S2I4H3_9BACT|nr:sulfate adenylyltransferase subunit CysN [Salinivirga cyanobacteriivorans]ALO17130.1 Bifunctional enzyme CysN/CysC [Salinivirga cyanobacteriivorans]
MKDENYSTQSQSTEGYLDMELLRFTTAGSVDDGKSTLIGRLLYDSKSIFEDQLDSIEEASERMGSEDTNLALLTDGLRAEREQGITIDVAYRYFATPKRKFIIADTPGHIQYTRNMVTGASTANAAIVLIDARNGVLEQTKRHAFIANLLQIPHVLLCVNKMDLVDFSQERYEEIKADFQKVADKLNIPDIHFIPMSAKEGDNVVTRSETMTWYEGPTLLNLLETLKITSDKNYTDKRLPVQYVIRPLRDEYHDYRGYAGRVAGGVFKKGDKVAIMPSGIESTVKSVSIFDKELEEAYPPLSVAIELEDDIDISRGDMIVDANNKTHCTQEMDLMITWMSEKPMAPGGKYILKHTSNEVKCKITNIKYRLDINKLEIMDEGVAFGLNDIGRISIKTTKPLNWDAYNRNRITGSLILIEEGTNNTVGAGMLVDPEE